MLVLGLFSLVACEKVLFEPDLASSDPYANFDYLWSELDARYSYFELKNIDWEAVRVEYRSRISAGMSEEELFDVIADLLNELRDDHSNLFSPFNVSRYNIELQHPVNFNARTVEEFYLPEGRITGPFFHDFIADGEVGYIRYGSFSSTIGAQSIAHVLDRYSETRGLVFDLRGNGGGSIVNVARLLERFTDEPVQAGWFITRNGPAHGDFGERQDFSVTPADARRYTKPVMVLIDRGSYSATTMFAVAAKAFPNLTLVGDTTGGGGGLPNGGQLPNGWYYRFSVSQLLDLNGENHAEDGVVPDIVAAFDWSDLTRDEIIDRAVEELID